MKERPVDALRYAAAAAVDAAGWWIRVEIRRLQNGWMFLPETVHRVARELSAKIAPCGCNAGGWETCGACNFGEHRSELCRCHKGEP